MADRTADEGEPRLDSFDEILAPVRRMFASLQRAHTLASNDIDTALAQLTEASVGALGVAHSSVWTFSADRNDLSCLDRFEVARGSHSSGARVRAVDAPGYFAALRDGQTIATPDARADRRTNEMADLALTPVAVVARIETPLWCSGRVIGVIRHEHIGDRPRAWTPSEVLVAGVIADYASMVLGTAERIAQTRAFEREAFERDRLLEGIFSVAPFGLAFLGPDYRYTKINDWLVRLNGVPREATIGKTPSEVLAHPDVARTVQGLVAQVFATGKPSEVLEMPGHPGSRPQTFLVSFYPVTAAERITHVGCFVVEITAQRDAERERGELLERETNARREAEAANRAKDEFLAVLGHELRNPLAPIATALHLMRAMGNTAAVERAVIERQVDHLSRLVDDMLDVVRITRGKIELRPKPVELLAIVEEGIEMASPLLERRGHTLHVDVAGEGLRVDGDINRLGQVVSNLLTNAAKCTPHGGRVAVAARAEGAEVVLSVRDSGVGIPAELLPRIFEAFVQGERRPDRSQGGLGLGLAIVRGIVAAHGGTVSARSEGLGRGSEFFVRLPALPVVVPTGNERELAASWKPSGPTRRVLIVDDNEDAAVLLAKLLERYGHQTRTSFDGPSALAIAAAFGPDVVLLDLGLPVMDGFEVARRLRELPHFERLKLVAVTGYGSPRDFQRSLAAGFHEHLVKPIDIGRIETLMAELFDRDSNLAPSNTRSE